MKNALHAIAIKMGAIILLIHVLSLIGLGTYGSDRLWLALLLGGLSAAGLTAFLWFTLLTYQKHLYQTQTEIQRLQQQCGRNTQQVEFLQTILNTLPQQIFSRDCEGYFTFANACFCQASGLPIEEILGRPLADFYPQDAAEAYQHEDRRVFETQEPLFAIVENLEPNETEQTSLQLIKLPLYDAQHILIGVLGVLWDISELKHEERVLRESQERYHHFMENAPLGILSINNEGTILDMNPMFIAMLGSPSEEATRSLNMLTSPSLVESGIAEDFRQALEMGMPNISERYYETKWGKQVYFRSHLMPIRNTANAIIGVQAIIEDNTENKLAELALRESEAEYHSLFQNMLSGLAYHKIIVDEHNRPIDFVFLEINDAFERLLGLTKDIIGRRGTEVIPEIKDLEPNLIDVYGNVALSGKEVTFDFYFEPFGAWYSIAAYSPEKGYFIALYDDITERKWAEESLRKMNEDLEQRVEARTLELKESNRALQKSLKSLERAQEQLVQSEKMAALGALVAGVAHEINTPLGIGVTAASLLEQKSQQIQDLYHQNTMKRSDLEKYLRVAVESSNMILGNLRRASENIQSFKLVAVDQTSDEKRHFKLKEYINDVLLSLYPKLKRTQHAIYVNCPASLELTSYPGAFSQIITNFVLNSLIHGFENRMEPGEIVIDVHKEEEGLSLQYRDNGRGMNEQERTRIFEPFFTTKRGQGGSGLGLHIVYNLVTQRLNGQIECQSVFGEGTTFIIWIPV